MSYLLDTSAISEWARPLPDPGIVQWLDDIDEDHTYLSVITLGELRKIVDSLPEHTRRDRLNDWLASELPDRFGERLLPVDAVIADEWGRLRARVPGTVQAADGIDGLIAATAKVHGLRVVTRNASRFRHVGVAVVSPWLT